MFKFWILLINQMKLNHKMSTAFYLQTDEQMEKLN